MSQCVAALAANLDGLGLISGPRWWKERTDSSQLFFDLYAHMPACHGMTSMCPHVLAMA